MPVQKLWDIQKFDADKQNNDSTKDVLIVNRSEALIKKARSLPEFDQIRGILEKILNSGDILPAQILFRLEKLVEWKNQGQDEEAASNQSATSISRPDFDNNMKAALAHIRRLVSSMPELPVAPSEWLLRHDYGSRKENSRENVAAKIHNLETKVQELELSLKHRNDDLAWIKQSAEKKLEERDAKLHTLTKKLSSLRKINEHAHKATLKAFDGSLQLERTKSLHHTIKLLRLENETLRERNRKLEDKVDSLTKEKIKQRQCPSPKNVQNSEMSTEGSKDTDSSDTERTTKNGSTRKIQHSGRFGDMF